MPQWKSRFRASAIHFVLSMGISIFAALLVFGVWYPYPYREISGGRELFILVMVVDVITGPLITLVIFNRKKTNRHIVMDFLVVGLLQVAALSYGLWTVFAARPVHLVFEYHRVAVVHAADIDPATLDQTLPALRFLPLTGPTLLSLRPFKDGIEEYTSTMAALSGVPQAAQPSLWQSWDAARLDILKESRPVAELEQRFSGQTALIRQVIAETNRPAERLRYLPLLARKVGWTVIIDAQTTMPVGFLQLDSF